MKEYIEKYRSRIILMGLFVYLFHGAKLNSNIIGIDTEDIIRLQDKFYGGWLSTGRQGLMLLKTVFGTLNFEPYYAGFMTVVLFFAAIVAFLLLWDKISGGISKYAFAGWAFCGFLWSAHPIMTEQFYFSLQSMEICIGILMTALALFLTVKWTEEHKWWMAVSSVILLIISFGIYQVFVVWYIFGTVTILLLQGCDREQDNIKAVLQKKLLPHMIVFLLAFAINTVITRLFFGSSDYLQGQILWGQVSVWDNLRAILAHIVRAWTGWDSIYYNSGYGLLCILTILLFFLFWKQKKAGKGMFCLQLLFLIASMICPFLMTIICGGAPVVRSQLILPVMTGFMGYFCMYLLGKLDFDKKIIKQLLAAAISAVCLVGGMIQLKTTEGLYYTDRCRYEQDVAIGREMIARINEVQGEYTHLPIAVIGSYPFQGNHACLEGEVIGQSFFAYDTTVEPAYYWSTRRVLGFLHVLGGRDYVQLNEDNMAEALECSTYMPSWPAEGSVQLWDDIIVVKLSHYE